MRLQKLIQIWIRLLLTCFIITEMLTLSGCAHLAIPVDVKDEPLYFLKGPSGAVQFYFLSDGQKDLTKDEWDAISEGMVAMPASSWADFDKEIGELCSQVTCDYEVIQRFHVLYQKIAAMRAGK